MKPLTVEVQELIDRVGSVTLVAEAVDCVSVANPQSWANGTAVPNMSQLRRLYVLRDVMDIVKSKHGAHAARAWVFEEIPSMNSLRPVDIIRIGKFDEAKRLAQDS